MKSINESILHLNQLVLDGKLLEAFDLYNDESVEMQENEMPPTVGKSENREREITFLNNITEFREAKVLDLAVSGNVSFVTWQYDYTHKEWGIRKYTQVSVQHWNKGKITREQFFYAN